MATLSGRTIASSYTELLKTTSSSGVTGSLDTVQDGDATDSALQLSSAAVKSLGTLTSIGNLDVNTDKFTVNATSGNSTVGGTLGVTGVITATAGVAGDLTGDVYASNGSSKILENGTDGTDATLTGLASEATQLATARNIALTGDTTGTASFNGTADATIATTLAASGVTAATYGSATKSARITISAKGLITGASEVTITGGGGGGGSDATSIQGIAVSSDTPTTSQALLYDGADSYDPVSIVLAADAVSTNTASKVVKRDVSGNFAAGTITAALTGNASTATAFATGRDISLTGDATGTATGFDGTGNASIAATLASTAVTAASYGSASQSLAITVDAKGRLTAAAANTIAIAHGAVSGLGTAATLAAADANWNANELQGRTVASTAPSDGQTLAWNNTATQWEPTTGAATNANQLQGRAIQNVSPTDQYVLLWNNTASEWQPSLTTTASITDDSITYGKMQDTSTDNRLLGAATAGTIGEVQVATDMVADDAVTYAKVQNVSATDKILGRSTAGAGVIEEIDCTAAGRALLDDTDAAAQRTTLGAAALATVQTFTAGQRGEVTTLSSSLGSVAIELDDSNNFSLTMTEFGTTLANPTSTPVAGQSGCIVITQDSLGSSYTLDYGTQWHFEGGTHPTLSTGANDVDTLAYYVASATSIQAVLLKDMS